MKKFLLFVLMIFTCHICNAQRDSGRFNRLEAIKMAYITDNLNLSPGEAERFWPIYNNYNQEIQRARQDYPNDVVGYESKVVEIRKRYQGQFQHVLNNPERVNKVFTSENNYRDLLRNEWQKRQEMKRLQNNNLKPRQLQRGKPY